MRALDMLMAYRQPFRARVARRGLLAAAPASVAYAALTLVVSAAWRVPGPAHRTVAACCAWHAADLAHGTVLPLFASAFLVMRPIEAVWTVACIWLVFGPLEAVLGSRRFVAVGLAGHVVATAAIDLCWLAGPGTAAASPGWTWAPRRWWSPPWRPWRYRPARCRSPWCWPPAWRPTSWWRPTWRPPST